MKDWQLFQAVLNRIGQQGDMHIRIRSETFRRILLKLSGEAFGGGSTRAMVSARSPAAW